MASLAKACNFFTANSTMLQQKRIRMVALVCYANVLQRRNFHNIACMVNVCAMSRWACRSILAFRCQSWSSGDANNCCCDLCSFAVWSWAIIRLHIQAGSTGRQKIFQLAENRKRAWHYIALSTLTPDTFHFFRCTLVCVAYSELCFHEASRQE